MSPTARVQPLFSLRCQESDAVVTTPTIGTDPEELERGEQGRQVQKNRKSPAALREAIPHLHETLSRRPDLRIVSFAQALDEVFTSA